MGFRLCGLAIDRNFSDNIHSLFKSLNIGNSESLEESTFDETTLDILQDDKIAICFFERGTLLITGIELMTNEGLLTAFSAKQSVVAFYIDDITSTYCFDFYCDGKYVRKKWISLSDKNIDSSDNFGSLLEVEKSEKDDQEIIFKLIGSVLGLDYYEIEEDAPMFVYNIQADISGNKKIEKRGFWKKLFG